MDLKAYGPWALIIGGSDGLGESFARKLAAQGFKLVLVARRPGPLEALAEDLRAQGVEVRIASVDMTQPDALEQVGKVTDDIEVGLLIYNAGVILGGGEFIRQPPEHYLRNIALNVTGHAAFSHHYGGLMCARGRGGIILVGSTGSFMGSPGLSAMYCGVKAFSRIFSEGIWHEMEKHGVAVLHFCLDYTDTPTNQKQGLDLAHAQSPDSAAQQALDNISNGPILIAGGQAQFDGAAQRSLLPGRAEAVRAADLETVWRIGRPSAGKPGSKAGS